MDGMIFRVHPTFLSTSSDHTLFRYHFFKIAFKAFTLPFYITVLHHRFKKNLTEFYRKSYIQPNLCLNTYIFNYYNSRRRKEELVLGCCSRNTPNSTAYHGSMTPL